MTSNREFQLGDRVICKDDYMDIPLEGIIVAITYGHLYGVLFDGVITISNRHIFHSLNSQPSCEYLQEYFNPSDNPTRTPDLGLLMSNRGRWFNHSDMTFKSVSIKDYDPSQNGDTDEDI